MQFPGWVSAILDLGSNFGACYSGGHWKPRLDPLVSWCIVQLPSMKPVLGAMTNLYHFNHHLKQGVIHIPSTFTSKISVTKWIGGCISEFNESTFTRRFSPSYQAWIIRPCCQPINGKIITWRYSQRVRLQIDRYSLALYRNNQMFGKDVNWHSAPHSAHNCEKFSSEKIIILINSMLHCEH